MNFAENVVVPAPCLIGHGTAQGVLLTTRDLGVLDNLVHCGMSAGHPVRPLLMDKLERAVVCDEAPADLITIDSRVLFRIGFMPDVPAPIPQESRVLVLPSRYVPNGLCLSLTTPLGAVLVGMRTGWTLEYTDLAGRRLFVTPDEVMFQPRPRRTPA